MPRTIVLDHQRGELGRLYLGALIKIPHAAAVCSAGVGGEAAFCRACIELFNSAAIQVNVPRAHKAAVRSGKTVNSAVGSHDRRVHDLAVNAAQIE